METTQNVKCSYSPSSEKGVDLIVNVKLIITEDMVVWNSWESVETGSNSRSLSFNLIYGVKGKVTLLSSLQLLPSSLF